MKDITITISGTQVTITEKDFWYVCGILRQEAIRKKVRDHIGWCFNRGEYDLTDEEYEGVIENISESIFYEADENADWDGIVKNYLEYALEDWDIDLDERRKTV